jgi:hypothetical protein
VYGAYVAVQRKGWPATDPSLLIAALSMNTRPSLTAHVVPDTAPKPAAAAAAADGGADRVDDISGRIVAEFTHERKCRTAWNDEFQEAMLRAAKTHADIEQRVSDLKRIVDGFVQHTQAVVNLLVLQKQRKLPIDQCWAQPMTNDGYIYLVGQVRAFARVFSFASHGLHSVRRCCTSSIPRAGATPATQSPRSPLPAR